MPLLILGLLGIQGISLVICGLRINLSASLPRGFYRLEEGEVRAGDLVVACLEKGQGRLGRERGYLGRGRCPGGASPVLKRVEALGGERPWPARVRAIDRRGRPLMAFSVDEPLGANQLWLAGDHPHSWDSRYFGPVDRGSVLGIARPIWIWESAPQDERGLEP